MLLSSIVWYALVAKIPFTLRAVVSFHLPLILSTDIASKNA